jgi:hypothetical protein
MPMVFFICPCHLHSRQSLPVSGDKMCGSICKPNGLSYGTETKKEGKPSDLKKGNIVKALLDSVLHFMKRLCSGDHAVLRFGHTPVLLNKVQLTMVFGVEVADMATGCY